MAVSWELTFSQSRCYLSTFSLYRLSATRDPVTKLYPDQATPTLVAEGIPGCYSYTLNDNDPLPEVGARAKRRSMLTEDAIEVPVLSGTDLQGNPIDIRADDFLKDTTAGDDNLATAHRVMGAPRKLTSQGSFATNCWLVQIFEEEKPPF